MTTHADYGLVEFCLPYLRARDSAGLTRALRRHASNELLVRILSVGGNRAIKVALVALSLTGRRNHRRALVRMLGHRDLYIVRLAEHALSCISIRQGSLPQNALLCRAIRLMAADATADAMLLLNRILVENPRFAEASYRRGLLHHEQGNYNEAVQDFRKAVELNPYHYSAFVHLGHTHLEIGYYAAALDAYYRALSIHPHLSNLDRSIHQLRRLLKTRRDTFLSA